MGWIQKAYLKEEKDNYYVNGLPCETNKKLEVYKHYW
jgi:hypothetical protein